MFVAKKCDSKSHVTPWSLQKLKPFNSLKVREITYDLNEEIEYGNGGELIADAVLVGDNIVVKVGGSSNEDF